MSRYLLAHDLGTSGNKATLFGLDGELVRSVTVEYGTEYSNGNWAEQNPDDWWNAVCLSSRKLLKGLDPKEIASVCFSGQMMGCLPIDRKGRALRSHLLYCDQRSTDQEEVLKQRVGMEEVYRITGHRASASYGITKLMWIRDHQPGVFRETWKMVNAKDFMNYRLTGRVVTEYNDASGTNAFDLSTLTWSDRILDAVDIPMEMMPEAVKSTQVIGEITREAAEATGLAAGTPVVAGAGDGGCATVGAGSVRPGTAYNYLGSSSWISTTSLKPILDPDMRTFTWAHPVPGYMQPCGTMQTAGSSYTWLKNEIARIETREAVESGDSVYQRIDQLIESSPPGARGVLFLPYMLGERSPRWNPEAKGAFLNLNLETKREDLFRSVLEGITMNLEIILHIFRSELSIDQLLVIGGGAKGAVWNQIMADIFEIEILVPKYLEEATSMGAAIIGGVGCGAFGSFDEADRFIQVTRSILPRKETQGVYRPLKALFEAAYAATEPLFGAMKRFS
jgi:xylulokinase